MYLVMRVYVVQFANACSLHLHTQICKKVNSVTKQARQVHVRWERSD